MREDARIALLYGGEGNEREISLRTGEAMLRALQERGAQVTAIDFRSGSVRTLLEAAPDVVLLGLHGGLGEGGAVQGLLECLGLPYTGSGMLASALAMDKVRTKEVFAQRGVPTPQWSVVAADALCPVADLPRVVKPSCEGSSVGVSLVRSAAEWDAALARTQGGAGAILVEELVIGREFTVPVQEGRALGIVEVIPAEGFYDYDAKYERDDTTYRFPAQTSAQEAEAILATAEAAYRALGCRGVARTDVMLDGRGNALALEVNTLPGMTRTSIVPQVARGLGIAFGDFLWSMIEAATTDEREAARRGQR